jgi:hypothetical protein
LLMMTPVGIRGWDAHFNNDWWWPTPVSIVLSSKRETRGGQQWKSFKRVSLIQSVLCHFHNVADIDFLTNEVFRLRDLLIRVSWGFEIRWKSATTIRNCCT